MADGEKPYRLYRGGRVKGKVPTLTRPERRPPRDGARGDASYPGPGPKKEPKRRRLTRGRVVLLILVALLVLVVVWMVAGYLAFASGVSAANKRLGAGARAALNHQGGALISTPTDILLLGSD